MRKAAGCVLLAILCLLGASYLPRILQEAQTDREQQNLISGYIQNPDTTDEENTESTTDEPEEETDPNMERIVDFQNLQQINPEILAWITVPGTPIDYPVALGEDNSYYLNHTVTGESNILGSIFATAGTDFEESHIILYGHNMASGKMFGSLKKYHDKDFRNTYPYVYVYTPETYRIFLALQILGATLVSVFFMINFFKETTDIKHGMTMEASIQFFIKLALVDAVFLNLTNILVFLIEIEQAFFGIIVPEDAASLVIRVGDDWEMSGSGLIFGNLFGLVFLFICLGGAVITLWTVYRVFLKLFFYMAVAPLALSTYAGPHEIGHTGSSWVRTFLCALFEMTGIMLMMRLGTILINAGGLFPTASEDILGGMLGSQGWEGLQAILGILIITGSVSGTDAMVRRAFGF